MTTPESLLHTRPVIAIVGAGSLNWGRSIVVDLMRHPDLANAEIRLIDILEDRLALVHEWCTFARQRLGTTHTLHACTNLREGLKGATACLTAIAVGGDRLWRYDATHPQLDGIFQPVGDSTGPGGALRALRHAPALRNIGLTLAEVGQPGALLLQLTNPLNALTACLDTIPGIQVVGFCHGYDDTERIIAQALHRGPRYQELFQSLAWRTELPSVRVELAGNNHFVFADKIHIGDRTYSSSEIHELTPQLFDGPFREAVWSRFGAYVGNYARHPIEFLPGFISPHSRYGMDWGVEPVAAEINPLNGERHDHSQSYLEAALSAARANEDSTATWPLAHSREPLDDIVAAFHTGARLDVHLNLRNQGGLSGLSDDLHLEMFCHIEEGTIIRPTVKLPEAVTREVERVGNCQLTLAACCKEYNEDLLYEALNQDALMPKNEGIGRRLVREMVAFQREWIETP